MPSMVFELKVEMADGGPTYLVVADQRDIARWEVQSFGWPVQNIEASPSMLFFRFLAWSVSVRQGLTDLAWDDWNEQCLEALPPGDDDEPEGEPAPDPLETPGVKAPSAARTSRSRSRAAKA